MRYAASTLRATLWTNAKVHLTTYFKNKLNSLFHIYVNSIAPILLFTLSKLILKIIWSNVSQLSTLITILVIDIRLIAIIVGLSSEPKSILQQLDKNKDRIQP